jgi:hypothetical protein
MTTDRTYAPGKRRGAQQTIDLASAYEAMFVRRNPTPEAHRMVMDDLAEFSGYFATLPRGASHAELAHANGMREVFSRILSLSKLSESERTRLREAALIEMQISNAEGER